LQHQSINNLKFLAMKNLRVLFFGLLTLISLFSLKTMAQDEEKTTSFTAGADFYSNYIWRGSKFGTGPAFQPSVKFLARGLTVGVWGSFDAFGYTETDPYISYSLPFGLSLGVTDYYYPTHIDTTGSLVGSDFFDFDKESGFHALEINGGYTIKGLTLSANYIVNEAAGAASSGGDMYFQIGYAFSSFNMSVGAGNGWHTSDKEFNVCQVAIGTSKTIEVTDKFSVPVTGSVILNPDKKQLFVVVGFSL
jgi:hypothetical protein